MQILISDPEDPASSTYLVRKSAETLSMLLADAIQSRRVHSQVTPDDNLGMTPTKDTNYIVDLKQGKCTCSDHVVNHMVCKHLYGVMHYRPPLEFADLPESEFGATLCLLSTQISLTGKPL
eukprot:gene8281-1551_t